MRLSPRKRSPGGNQYKPGQHLAPPAAGHLWPHSCSLKHSLLRRCRHCPFKAASVLGRMWSGGWAAGSQRRRGGISERTYRRQDGGETRVPLVLRGSGLLRGCVLHAPSGFTQGASGEGGQSPARSLARLAADFRGKPLYSSLR